MCLVLTSLTTEELLKLREQKERERIIYNKTQQALKIVMNGGTYGIFATDYFTFNSHEIASTITAQGRSLVKYGEKILVDYFINIWASDTELHNKIRKDDLPLIDIPVNIPNDKKNIDNLRIIMDTDSVHISLEEFLRLNFDFDINDYVLARKIMLKIYNDRLEQYIVDKLKEYEKTYNSFGTPQFEMENIHASETIISGKVYISDSIFKTPNMFFDPGQRIKFTGVQIIRSDTSKFARTVLVKEVKNLIANAEKMTFENVIDRMKIIKQKMEDEGISVTSKQMSINNYDKYINQTEHGVRYTNKTPMQLKAAALYNYMLSRNSKYRNKYSFIQNGDKIVFYPIKPIKVNGQVYEVFGFKFGEHPFEFAPKPDVEELFQKNVLNVMNKFVEVIYKKSIPPTLDMGVQALQLF